MDITYSQKEGVKLLSKGVSLVIDGPHESKADITLFAQPLDTPLSLTSFDGPGEYEVKGCMIDGVALGDDSTAYRVEADDLRVSYLPVVPAAEQEKSIDTLAGCDVLLMPLNGSAADRVAKLVATMEPKVVIPIHYSQAELDAFLAEMGAKEVQPTDKLKLQRKDLGDDKQQIVVLAS